MPVHPTYFQQQAMSPAPSPTARKPTPKRKPLLRLELRDLAQEGTRAFLSLLDCATAVDDAVAGVLQHLYSPHADIPPIRSITLILRPMPGVAYTTGLDLDNDHKEIHFSTDYIASVPVARRKQEILGVLRHEMVHCWQWNARGTAPGGLVEGIADYVRLRSGFVPPHWRQEADGDWDAGYQHTGYFLDYLEGRFGPGSIMAVNETLRDRDYDEAAFWKSLFGKDVQELWSDYGQALKKCNDNGEAADATGEGGRADAANKQHQPGEPPSGAV